MRDLLDTIDHYDSLTVMIALKLKDGCPSLGISQWDVYTLQSLRPQFRRLLPCNRQIDIFKP
jgi:hypothetical protein